jgi:hypothetical protein
VGELRAKKKSLPVLAHGQALVSKDDISSAITLYTINRDLSRRIYENIHTK